MSKRYEGEQLSHALLMRRRQEIQERHGRTLKTVTTLVETQKEIGEELSDGLSQLDLHGTELDRLAQAESETGLLSVLTRRFTARRTALTRKSVAEGLMRHYERVSVRLREATAFSDDLRLCALELQDEVDKLHEELGQAVRNQKKCADRILEIEQQLQGLEGLSPEEFDRQTDALEFQLRTEMVNLGLFGANIEHCRQHLEPARALRDTVMTLHEEMADFVLSATHTVNSAGRRIQGLGMLADAPAVVTELQESLNELNDAMSATQAYVETSQEMLAKVLPDLSARLKAEAELESAEVTQNLDQVSREHARHLAERALKEAAEDEIQKYLGDP